MSAQYRPYRDEDCSDGPDTDHLNWSDEPGSIQIYEKTTEALPFHANRRRLGTIGLAVICLLGGFLVGYMSHVSHSECIPTMSVALSSVKDADSSIRGKILNKVSAEGIRTIVREFSKEARIPGSPFDFKLAKQIADFFHAHHFDKVEIKNYTVLLSLPNENRPNTVEVTHFAGGEYSAVYSTKPTLTDKDNGFATPYSAYSPSADLIVSGSKSYERS